MPVEVVVTGSVTTVAVDRDQVTVEANPAAVSVVGVGVPGPAGPQGPQGAAGVGVPAGGTTGQALVKASNADYATAWQTVTVSPGGANTQIQFNANGAFAGSVSLTWDEAAKRLTVGEPGATRNSRLLKDSLYFYEFTGTVLFAISLNDSGTGPRIDAASGGYAQFTSAVVISGAVIALNGGVVPLRPRGATGQTEDLFQCLTSIDAIQFAIGAGGRIKTNQAAAAATLGSVTKKVPIYDQAGALVGYVPLYDSIT